MRSYLTELYSTSAFVVEHYFDVTVSAGHKLHHKLTARTAGRSVSAVRHDAQHLVYILLAICYHIEDRISFSADTECRAGVDAHPRIYLPGA